MVHKPRCALSERISFLNNVYPPLFILCFFIPCINFGGESHDKCHHENLFSHFSNSIWRLIALVILENEPTAVNCKYFSWIQIVQAYASTHKLWIAVKACEIVPLPLVSKLILIRHASIIKEGRSECIYHGSGRLNYAAYINNI